MDFPPSGKKWFLLITDDPHRPAQIVCFHALHPHKRRKTIRPDQVDLGVTVTEHMHMGWFVIVGKDDGAQTLRTKDTDHTRI